MKTPKNKYNGKRWIGTALVVVAALVAALFLGCKQEADSVEPVPEVFVEVKGTADNFLMSDHEVTQGEYEKYCTYSDLKPVDVYGKGTNFPAYYVSWYDAIVYCNMRSLAEDLTPCYTINGSTAPADWGPVPTSNDGMWNAVTCNFDANGYRLPTEAEWEYAARGGNQSWSYTYAGSNTVDDVAWYSGNSGSKTHEVKGKKANGLDLYDMSGNVWEWCWDSSGSNRVRRGGAWVNSANYCAVSGRYNFTPYGRNYIGGLRVVRTVVPTQN